MSLISDHQCTLNPNKLLQRICRITIFIVTKKSHKGNEKKPSTEKMEHKMSKRQPVPTQSYRGGGYMAERAPKQLQQ